MIAADKRESWVAACLIGLGLMLVALAACSTSSPSDSDRGAAAAPAGSAGDQRDAAPRELTEDDQAAIHSAVIRQIYKENPIFEGERDIPTVYLAGVFTEPLRTKVVATLGDLTHEFEWVRHQSEAPRDDRGEVIGVVISFGTISQLPDGSVHLMGRLLCGSLCGMFRTYTVKQVGGVWNVVDAGPIAVS